MAPEIFLPCHKLTQIILRDNELSHAHSSWFRAFYYKSRYRPYIDLSGNPWRCECSMISFRAWTNRNMWFLNIDGFQDVTCWTPSEVRGTSLLHLNGTQVLLAGWHLNDTNWYFIFRVENRPKTKLATNAPFQPFSTFYYSIECND